MGQVSRAGGDPYIQPIGTTGARIAGTKRRGVYTLTAGTLYYFVIGTHNGLLRSVHLTGSTAALIIISATIQDGNQGEKEVLDFSSTGGEWIPEDPTSADVELDGAGWSATNGVVAVAGGAVGGAMWHMSGMSARRTRLAVQVGGTGGDVCVSIWGIE